MSGSKKYIKDHESPPAFPCEHEQWEGSCITRVPWQGMSLRDYFAAKALHSCLDYELTEGYEDAADRAYRIADAMMRRREVEQ